MYSIQVRFAPIKIITIVKPFYMRQRETMTVYRTSKRKTAIFLNQRRECMISIIASVMGPI